MNIVDRAIEVAAVAHRDQTRKGTTIPYISHPYAVGLMLARAGMPDEVVAAGILHDTLEDTTFTAEEIREQFGDAVARIVDGCTEPHRWETWEKRKQHTLAYLPTAAPEVRAVMLADKLHNLRTIAAELSRIGEAAWQRFKRGREEQEWYYRGLAAALCDEPQDPMEAPYCAEFRDLVDRVFDRHPNTGKSPG